MCSGDNDLGVPVSGLNDLFLNDRHQGGGGLYTQVAARDHHAVCCMNNGVQIFYSRGAFQFGNDRGVFPGRSQLLDQVAHVFDILFRFHERNRDKINPVRKSKFQVRPILFRKTVNAKVGTGQIDSLVRHENTAEDDPGLHRTSDDFGYLQLQFAVIEKNSVTRPDSS